MHSINPVRDHCCILGCNNKRPETVLHYFPGNEEKKKKWLSCINSDVLRQIPKERLKKLSVCHKHFEDRFVSPSGRLRYGAYPALFTPEEIASGVPHKTIEDIYVPHKDYFTKGLTHYDHTYSKDDAVLSTDDNNEDVTLMYQNHPQSPILGVEDTTIDADAELLNRDITKSKLNLLNDNTDTHTEYTCDHCSEDIIGYTCVQCENFDLCGACESRLVHPRHYMLRVPRPRPFNEVKSILDSIREKIKLLTEEWQKNSMELDTIKSEPDCEEATMDPLLRSPVMTAQKQSNLIDPSLCNELLMEIKRCDIDISETTLENNAKRRKLIDVSSENGGSPCNVSIISEDWLDDSVFESDDVHSENISRSNHEMSRIRETS